MLCIVFNKDLLSFVYYCKPIMKQNINIIPSIFTFSSIKNIIIARISQIRHFQKFIGICGLLFIFWLAVKDSFDLR